MCFCLLCQGVCTHQLVRMRTGGVPAGMKAGRGRIVLGPGQGRIPTERHRGWQNLAQRTGSTSVGTVRSDCQSALVLRTVWGAALAWTHCTALYRSTNFWFSSARISVWGPLGAFSGKTRWIHGLGGALNYPLGVHA